MLLEALSPTVGPPHAAAGRHVRGKEDGQANRQISTGQLNTLLHLHLRPINLVVFEVPLGYLVLGEASRLYAFSVYPFRT